LYAERIATTRILSQSLRTLNISGCLKFNLKNTVKNGLLQSGNFTLEIALQVSGTTVRIFAPHSVAAERQ